MRKFFLSAVILFISGIVGTWSMGTLLAHPNLKDIESPPVDLAIEEVSIVREQNDPIYGWYVEGSPSLGGVLLLHSVRSNRLEMIDRAKFLNDAGYAVLLIDMQAHGETRGELITFGYLEAADAKLAFNYLKAKVDNRGVGIVGVSLGGAAVLLGEQPIEADAIVLEAVYSSLRQAVENRIAIRLGEFGRELSPLLLWQIEPRLGIPLDKLSPISTISKVMSPLMIVSGTEDMHTLPRETKDMYNLAPEPKLLWMVEGAKHQNLHKYSKPEYEKRVLKFFKSYL